MSPETQGFESWAIVEVMGHRRYSGLVTEQQIGGTSFVRIDVPEWPADKSGAGAMPAFTKLFGASSIYCITPVSEEIARATARTPGSHALHELQLPADYRQALSAGRRVLEAKQFGPEEEDDDDYGDYDPT